MLQNPHNDSDKTAGPLFYFWPPRLLYQLCLFLIFIFILMMSKVEKKYDFENNMLQGYHNQIECRRVVKYFVKFILCQIHTNIAIIKKGEIVNHII